MKLTTITLGALAAVAILTGGANAQPNLQHRQLIQVQEPNYHEYEIDDGPVGLSLEQWEARKPNRQANRANRQARQAKRQVRWQTRKNRVDVWNGRPTPGLSLEQWEARKPIRQAKRENRQGRKVIRQAKLAQYKAKKRAQRKAIRPRRLRVYGLTLAEWEAQEADEEARTFDDFEAVGRSCADYPYADDC